MCSGAETDHQDNGGRKKQGGNANRNTNDEALQLHVREHAVTRVNEEQTQTGLVDVIEASAGVHDGAPGGGYGGRATINPYGRALLSQRVGWRTNLRAAQRST